MSPIISLLTSTFFPRATGMMVYLLGRPPWPLVLVISVSPAWIAPRGCGDPISLASGGLDTGNGRVYQISFSADDGQGGSCTGAVTVGVPHSQKQGLTAIDDGQIYRSTIP